ncbi:hypothetical protein [Pseudoxanthomonas sp. UTMC 1351]|uniref:hypothetical protein n=1 Tax=Pseudoxanthomonas sp. UTMC 1351 TaxID=2695853 RepID=UPI0034CF8C27
MTIGDPEWALYEAWCASGNTAQPFGAQSLPTLDEARALAIVHLHAAVDSTLAPILSQYATSEVSSWPVQLAEATTWLADSTAPTPLIDSLCGGTDKAALCASVIAKGNAYSHVSGAVFAWRRACSDWVETVTDVAALSEWNPQYPQVPYAA